MISLQPGWGVVQNAPKMTSGIQIVLEKQLYPKKLKFWVYGFGGGGKD